MLASAKSLGFFYIFKGYHVKFQVSYPKNTDSFDDQDEKIKSLLKNKKLNWNVFRVLIRAIKNRWFQEKPEQAEHFFKWTIIVNFTQL